jgi:hypothetical protein
VGVPEARKSRGCASLGYCNEFRAVAWISDVSGAVCGVLTSRAEDSGVLTSLDTCIKLVWWPVISLRGVRALALAEARWKISVVCLTAQPHSAAMSREAAPLQVSNTAAVSGPWLAFELLSSEAFLGTQGCGRRLSSFVFLARSGRSQHHLEHNPDRRPNRE